MKRGSLLLALTVWLMLCSALSAGERYVPRAGLSLGIQGGVTLPHFSGANNAGWNSSVGPVVGAYATFNFNSIVAFQPEILFITKGGEYPDRDAKITLKYYQFAGLIRITPPWSKWDHRRDLVPKILAGVAIGVKSSAELVTTGTIDVLSARKSDASIILGGGFDIPVDSRWRVTFDVRFDFSLSSFTYYNDLKNISAIFMLGVAF